MLVHAQWLLKRQYIYGVHTKGGWGRSFHMFADAIVFKNRSIGNFCECGVGGGLFFVDVITL